MRCIRFKREVSLLVAVSALLSSNATYGLEDKAAAPEAGAKPADDTASADAKAPAETKGGDDKAEDATPAKSAASSGAPDPEPDAAFRTFGGGNCLTEPGGSDKQLGPFAALLLPKLVSAGIDAATAALDKAGEDRIEARSTVLPIEYAVKCIEIAREFHIPSGYFQSHDYQNEVQRALKRAPFLIELFLRQSVDGSSLLVTPTLLNYQETLDGKRSRSKRPLYLTLTFSEPGSDTSTKVTVPLGSFATRNEPYSFDPMMAPWDPKDLSPLGAANSIWIPNPFHKPTKSKGGEGASATGNDATAQGSNKIVPVTPPAEHKPGQRNRQAVRASNISNDGFGGGDIPPPVAALPNDAAAAVVGIGTPESAIVEPGTRVAPFSISVAVIETRKGDAFARALSGVLKGAKSGIVDQVDPAKQAEARATEDAAAATKRAAVTTARGEYATALQAFCNEPLATQPTKAPALWMAQKKLSDASLYTHDELPFTQFVNPEKGDNAAEVCP